MMYECDEKKFKDTHMLVRPDKGDTHKPDRALVTFWGSTLVTHTCKLCQTPHNFCCNSLDACSYDVPFTLSLAALRLYPGAT
jgi:hypothetical protein